MRSGRRKESGFALLLVFLMAAIVGIMLFLEIPRVAFEAQRQKEQLLIDRGEQYKRAIKVFYTTNKRYPASLEELESFNNRRFLRKRYIDPMTGKDEWRPIHVQNGMLTDSKVVQPQAAGQQQTASTAGQYVGEKTYIGVPVSTGATPGVNLAQRRRASDDRPAGLVDAGNGDQPVISDPNGDPNASQNPGQTPYPGQVPAPVQVGQLPPGVPVPGAVPVMPGQVQGTPLGGGRFPGQIALPNQNPGMQNPGMQNPGMQNTGGGYVSAGGSYVGGSGSYVGGGTSYVGGNPATGSQPNAPAVPGQYPGAVPNQPPGVGTPGYNPTTGANGTPTAYGQPGVNQQGQNAAVGMIQNLLTTPRVAPGGGTGPQGTVIGGGIAGFASLADQEGIKVYGDRTNYSEWEFIYDPAKDVLPRNPATGSAGTPASQLGNTQGMGNQGMNPVGAPPQPGMNPG